VVGVVCGGSTVGRGILWVGSTLRQGYLEVIGVMWGMIVLDEVLWCGVSLSRQDLPLLRTV
jgi:hypothetical protein